MYVCIYVSFLGLIISSVCAERILFKQLKFMHHPRRLIHIYIYKYCLSKKLLAIEFDFISFAFAFALTMLLLLVLLFLACFKLILHFIVLLSLLLPPR